ncbi:MAG TPA: aminopeptidase [Thermoanaerobaculia bacterium]|nr:aminopeptidase [Thermoanaerobaculia bacterium]
MRPARESSALDATAGCGFRAPARSRRRWRRGAIGLLVAAAVSVPACTPIRYYTHAIWGGAKLMVQREPVERLLGRGHLSEDLRARLELALDIRDFASRELALPDNRSYRTYVATGRSAVTWNVVAAPELSVEPVVWCFPIAGCVSYRGYFQRERAERFARRLERDGLDVRVSPVAAFSTLGWFADPLLDTFLRYPDWQLAGLLFHELAHQVVYVPSDTTFNESFATVVEIEGVRRWLELEGRGEEIEAARSGLAQEAAFLRLLMRARACLAEAYASTASDVARRARKVELFAWLQQDGQAAIDAGVLGPGYQGWFAAPLNNADVASVADYEAYVPALREVFAEAGSFPGFYRAAAELAALAPEERARRLAAPSADLAAAGCPSR